MTITKFNIPFDIAIDSLNNAYVLNQGNATIIKFDNENNILNEYILDDVPYNMEFDHDENLWVINNINNSASNIPSKSTTKSLTSSSPTISINPKPIFF